MGSFLAFLAEHRAGVWLLIATLGALCVAVQWLCWIFRLGRFRRDQSISPTRSPSPLRFVIAEFFVRLINDFRHLLALVVVFMFALALFAAMLPGLISRDMATIKDGLQAVAAALAGLIGSIIGYYFGESAATKKEQEPRMPSASSPQPAMQTSPDQGAPAAGIRAAAKPPIAGQPGGGA